MAAIVLLVTLHLFDPRSLKQKRGVVRPPRRAAAPTALGQRRRGRNARRAAPLAIGLALVAPDLVAARRLLEDAKRAIDDQLIGRGEVMDATVEELTLESELR